MSIIYPQATDAPRQGKCTDPFLQLLDPVTVQAACLWRRALVASLEFNRIIPPTFARRLGVAVSVAQGLVNRLEREGYVRVPMKNKRLGKIVNKDHIRNTGIRKYFDKVRKEAESQIAQKAVPASETVDLTTDMQGERMDNITNGASSLSIGHMTNEPSATTAGVVATQPKVATLRLEDDESGLRRSPRIVSKRVRSAIDQSVEFELSNSQDMDLYSEASESRRKRRKASIASRSILV
jgi:hypothetical protein